MKTGSRRIAVLLYVLIFKNKKAFVSSMPDRRMTVKSIIIEVPENIAATLKIPSSKDVANELKKELALHLYEEGILSFGNAMKLAEMGVVEFHLLLGERKIPRHYGIDQYEEDITTVESRLKAV